MILLNLGNTKFALCKPPKQITKTINLPKEDQTQPNQSNNNKH